MSYHDVPVLVLVVLAAVGWLEVLVVIVVAGVEIVLLQQVTVLGGESVESV